MKIQEAKCKCATYSIEAATNIACLSLGYVDGTILGTCEFCSTPIVVQDEIEVKDER